MREDGRLSPAARRELKKKGFVITTPCLICDTGYLTNSEAHACFGRKVKKPFFRRGTEVKGKGRARFSCYDYECPGDHLIRGEVRGPAEAHLADSEHVYDSYDVRVYMPCCGEDKEIEVAAKDLMKA